MALRISSALAFTLVVLQLYGTFASPANRVWVVRRDVAENSTGTTESKKVILKFLIEK